MANVFGLGVCCRNGCRRMQSEGTQTTLNASTVYVSNVYTPAFSLSTAAVGRHIDGKFISYDKELS